MKISDLMTKNVTTRRPHNTLESAARAMWEDDIGCVVIVDDEHKPVGVVTDRDICMAAYTRDCSLKSTEITSLLGRSVVTCPSDGSFAEAAEAMALHQVRRLPVIDHSGALVGIVTLGDLSRASGMSATAAAVLGVIATPRRLAALESRNARPQSASKTNSHSKAQASS